MGLFDHAKIIEESALATIASGPEHRTGDLGGKVSPRTTPLAFHLTELLIQSSIRAQASTTSFTSEIVKRIQAAQK